MMRKAIVTGKITAERVRGKPSPLVDTGSLPYPRGSFLWFDMSPIRVSFWLEQPSKPIGDVREGAA